MTPRALRQSRWCRMSNVVSFRSPRMTHAERLAARRVYRKGLQALAMAVVSEGFARSAHRPGAGAVDAGDTQVMFTAAVRRELRRTGLF